MRPFCMKTLLWMSGAIATTCVAFGQQPSIAPYSSENPATYGSTTQPASLLAQDEDPVPITPEVFRPRAPQVPAAPPLEGAPVLSNEYADAMKGPRLGGHPGGFRKSHMSSDRSRWFGNIGGLVMTRARSEDHRLTIGDFDETLLSTRDARMPWAGGFEASVGQYFTCGHHGLEVRYWGLFPSTREASVFAEDLPEENGAMRSALGFGSLELDGVAAVELFDDADVHRLRRSHDFHNVELNLLGGAGHVPLDTVRSTVCPRLNYSWLAGFRFFRFSEGFEFAAITADDVNDGVDETFYTIDTRNLLFGVQLGGRADYAVTDRFGLYAGTKMGVFGNRIRHRSRVGTAEQAAWINDPDRLHHGEEWDIRSRKNDVSLLGEIDLGARYRLTSHWSVSGGYRAVGVSRVALATNQIPYDFDDLTAVGRVNSDSSLILHGAYATLDFNY